MLISNFNLYKNEWLELVFAKRNKEYGAYYLRQHQPVTQLKSFFIGVFGVALAVGIVGIVIKTKPVMDGVIVVDNSDFLYKIPPAAKIEPPKPKIEAQKPAAPKATAAATAIITTKFPPPVVAPDPVSMDPPKIDQIKGAVGQVDINKGEAGSNSGGDAGVVSGTGTGVADAGDASGTGVFKMVEDMPHPIGGEAAWAKFLQSNLRYTNQAMEADVSGRVYVTFIVEKDGHISSIKVERGPGFGLDEEAVRVLKLAKPWKPGIQNGRPVRVQLTLPVNFTLGN